MKLTPSSAFRICGRAIAVLTHHMNVPPTRGAAPYLRVIIKAVESVDEALVLEHLSETDLEYWFSSIIELQEILESWKTGSETSSRTHDAMRDNGPAHRLVELLKKLPDEHKPPDEDRFSFVVDPFLRRDLARDLAAAERLLALGEWKASTVLAGSVLEALLLDMLMTPALEARAKASKSAPQDGKWMLDKLIIVAKELNVIDDTDDERGSLKAAQAFRNLIHPSKALRLQRSADRSAAHIALGAALLLVEKFG